jgi:ABC-type branched-subunit amino acid transport system ATPase component
MLQLQGVSSGYPNLPVLFDINLRAEPGQLVSVLGGTAPGSRPC